MSAQERETAAAEFQHQLQNLHASIAATDERMAVIR
jgi:hypothetical protein